MKPSREHAHRAASSALSNHVARLQPTGPCAWSFALAPHVGWSGVAWLTEYGWLCLRVKPGTRLDAKWEARWNWMQWNAELPGGAKIMLDDAAAVAIGGEVPVGANLDDAVRGLIKGLLLAVDVLEGKGPPVQESRAGDDQAAVSVAHVAKICTEAGWACTLRANGTQVVVAMGATDNVWQVFMTRHDGPVVFFAELLSLAPSPPAEACLEAVSRLLLSLSAGMPTLRAVAKPGGNMSVGVEAVVTDSSAQDGIQHALGALAVLCQHTRKEVRALYEDPAVAETYLAFQQRKPGQHTVRLSAA